MRKWRWTPGLHAFCMVISHSDGIEPWQLVNFQQRIKILSSINITGPRSISYRKVIVEIMTIMTF